MRVYRAAWLGRVLFLPSLQLVPPPSLPLGEAPSKGASVLPLPPPPLPPPSSLPPPLSLSLPPPPSLLPPSAHLLPSHPPRARCPRHFSGRGERLFCRGWSHAADSVPECCVGRVGPAPDFLHRHKNSTPLSKIPLVPSSKMGFCHRVDCNTHPLSKLLRACNPSLLELLLQWQARHAPLLTSLLVDRTARSRESLTERDRRRVQELVDNSPYSKPAARIQRTASQVSLTAHQCGVWGERRVSGLRLRVTVMVEVCGLRVEG
jgi:hypothetical protein